MRVQAVFIYERFEKKINEVTQEMNMMIPQNIVMKMGIFFSKFALGHEEKPTKNNRGQTGYFNHSIFSHRGVSYTLYYALIIDDSHCQIQISLFTSGRAFIDKRFSVDEFLTFSTRPSYPQIQIDSTIESIKRDLSHLYYHIQKNEEMLDIAIKECCLKQVSHFKNHLNGLVKLTYYSELFKVYDATLNYSRIFHLPSSYASLRTPTLRDYLRIGSPMPFNFEPTFNNADTYKVIGTKKELLQFIKDDFRLSTRLPAILHQLLNHEYYHFKDVLEFKVGSHDRPVITVTRKKPSSYKKIHYVINNNIINSLIEN